MKKIVISLTVSVFAALLLANAALAATALDNLQIQINATVGTNNNQQKPAANTAPKKDDDEDEHKDNGKHLGQKKHDSNNNNKKD